MRRSDDLRERFRDLELWNTVEPEYMVGGKTEQECDNEKNDD